MHKVRGIQRKAVDRGDNLPALTPRAGKGIIVRTGQRKHSMLEQAVLDRLAGRRGKVDDPATVDSVQFGRPDQLAHFAAVWFSPNHNRRGLSQCGQRFSLADFQPVIFRDGGDKVVAAAIEQDKRIGALLD